jgi:transcriptional regulator NrdR family protein
MTNKKCPDCKSTNTKVVTPLYHTSQGWTIRTERKNLHQCKDCKNVFSDGDYE